MNWYGFLIATGVVLCVLLAYVFAKRRGIEGDTVIDIIICGMPFAIIFARIYYVVFDLLDPQGQEWTFRKFIGVDDGGLQGLAIYGALIGVAISLFFLSLYKSRKSLPENKKISYLQLLDLTFTFVMLGQSVGRWGNFANQEAHGYEITSPSKMWFPLGVKVGETWYYATFFYESMWDLIGFGIMLFLYAGKRKSFDGFSMSSYCIIYGLGRVWIEGMRSDSLWLKPPKNPATGAGGIRVSQLLSIILILFGITYIVIHIIRAKRAGKKVFIFVDRAKLDDSYFGYEKTKLANPMPDIVFFKDRKNRKKPAEEVVMDENGVMIRTAPEEQAEPNRQEQTPEKASPAALTPEQKQPEEEYEDRWDE